MPPGTAPFVWDGRMLLKTLAPLVGLALGVALLGGWLRPEVELLGQWLTEHLGAWGVFTCCFLAEAIHLPTPPQFFMLAAVTAGASTVDALLPIIPASLLGGVASYALGRWLGAHAVFQRMLVRWLPMMKPLMDHFGAKAVVVACVTPFPFSSLCLLCGVQHMRWRLFWLLLALRVPRLLVFFALIKLGWSV